ncbi:MAG: hypothetical protein ACUVXF_10540 [Desulfobaccales bacterium]
MPDGMVAELRQTRSYAMFYAAETLLLAQGHTFSSHRRFTAARPAGREGTMTDPVPRY